MLPNKPLPPHNKTSAFIEVSEASNKFIATLIDGEKRTPVRMFKTYTECTRFAHDNQLPVLRVGASS